MESNKAPQERIAIGECVSPMTVDECPYCVDRCEAAHWRIKLKETLKNLNIPEPPKQ